MSLRLEGKVAIVTGGASGYGKGIASKLKAEGAQVLLLDLNTSLGNQTATELDVTFLKADVTVRSDWEHALKAAIDTYGKLDIIVNNAGVSHDQKATETTTVADFDKCFGVNVKSLFLSSTVLLPYLLEKKSSAAFISIASTGGIRPRPGLTWYSASKAAVNTASNAMAVEYASRGIRFNTVCPVAGLTDMTKTILGPDELESGFLKTIPAGRLCTPADVGSAVCYLASDEANFITGVNLPFAAKTSLNPSQQVMDS
ncbi:hypothetical protein LTR20_005347 [Exophiala xenobiotica]|nr:hypothetical protein LTR93_001050 [Exophiala xenobiotica]KAK5385847.1 hypothetical protein LTS13_001482 [Exophiala xenobiotica]KAK5394186.1 hypothetical protein LTR79_008399 [Exophiala xenobiotica]KAK5405085.1 hypothetical protein LTR90_011088 [Exophiala xenobiotica]KAK5463266.1 hypothetical protein LTR20_005347 [Exophiala xenobiotica]